jgi:hypothetical protein
MKLSNSLLILSALALLVAFPIAPLAQWNKKPYTEWSEKDVKKLLENSPWGQTQVFSDTSNEFGTGIARGAAGTEDRSSGDYSAHYLNIRLRLLSSRPVRQAFARMVMLMQKGQVNDQLNDQLKAFATQDFPDFIIISLDCDAKETKNELREFKTLMDTRTLNDLKNNTYISGKNGERVFITAYQPPKNDNLGAKLIFPRLVNGAPFITPDTNEIHFYSEFSRKYILNMRYKVKDMMVDGKLEY